MRDSLIVFVFFAVGVALGYADAVPTWLLDPRSADDYSFR